jgi:hypothetical protein
VRTGDRNLSRTSEPARTTDGPMRGSGWVRAANRLFGRSELHCGGSLAPRPRPRRRRFFRSRLRGSPHPLLPYEVRANWLSAPTSTVRTHFYRTRYVRTGDAAASSAHACGARLPESPTSTVRGTCELAPGSRRAAGSAERSIANLAGGASMRPESLTHFGTRAHDGRTDARLGLGPGRASPRRAF